MKYKVGDKVRIKSLDWYNKNKDNNREIKFENGIFTILKSTFLGQIMTIEEITLEKQYILVEDRYKTLWTDEMIEGIVEDNTYSFKEGKPYPTDTICFDGEINLPDGYIFKDENGNIINAQKIVLEKKGSRYPKTYEECSIINGCEGRISVSIIGKFTRLINARNAYWRIAGQEMGLKRPWKPDWTNQKLPKYCIAGVEGQIKTAESYIVNTILAFPTAEMRDAFYEVFREEIEICKELL